MYDREIRRGTKDQLTQQTRRSRRYEVYRLVKELQQKGHNLHQVARELKLGLRRVRRYFASEQFPEQARPPRAKSILDPYVPYLQQAWDRGCHKNVSCGTNSNSKVILVQSGQWYNGPSFAENVPMAALLEKGDFPPVRSRLSQPLR
jgi:hypothetical protein